MGDKNKKIRIGWFTFSCCEDNTVIMTEIMNDHWQEWKQLFEFVHARVLQKNNKWEQMDIAFVEGAVSLPEHVKHLKKIRKLATKVVAIGSCAVVGLPAGQRNKFSEEQLAETNWLVERFKGLPKVKTLSEVVKIDAQVSGCPMKPEDFLAAVDTLVKEFQANN